MFARGLILVSIVRWGERRQWKRNWKRSGPERSCANKARGQKKKKRKSKCEQITGKDLMESKIIALHYGSDNEGLFCRRETMITGD
jgi:hypothetical protein